MYDLRAFRERVMELCARSRPYEDGRRASQQDLADAVGLSRPALSNRLNGTRGTKLTERDVRAIVRALAEWEAISSEAEARELLALVNCTPFTAAEWNTPPLDRLQREQDDTVAEGGIRHAAPPVTRRVQGPRHNLPLQLTSFIGREAQISEVERLLGRARLLTLLGPGGSGKTRLALELAARMAGRFADGVWLVELAGLSEPTLVEQTVARAVGVREQRGEELTVALIDYLRERELLLVLDNCEHLAGTCAALVHRLLLGCPNLRLLATSREALHTQGEVSWQVPAMSLPGPQARISSGVAYRYEAVRLFVERAGDAQPRFTLNTGNASLICQICERLDGLPLAIELAAALVGQFTPQALLARLDNRLPLLTGGARELTVRQQTLRGAIDWSYNLLSSIEQPLFACLAVFVGGFTLEAAAAVCGDFGLPISDFGLNKAASREDDGALKSKVLDSLISLANKSLLRTNIAPPQMGEGEGVQGETRFAMLETIREYALEKLSEGAAATLVRGRHAAYYLQLVDAAEPALAGSEQLIWLERLEREHDNLRAALAWSIKQDEVETALLLGRALWRFWYIRGYASEGRGWLEAALTKSAGRAEAARARALNSVGVLTWYQGDYAAARQFLEEGLAIHRQLGYKLGISSTLNNLGLVALSQGEYERAKPLFDESLAIVRELGDNTAISATLDNLGRASMHQGDYALAQARCTESLALKRALGDERGVAFSLNSLGRIAYLKDEPAAEVLFAESLRLYQELGSRQGVAEVDGNLGLVALQRGDYAKAARLLRDSLAAHHELGNKSGIAQLLAAFADLSLTEGQAARATTLLCVTDWLLHSLGAALPPVEQASQQRNLSTARTILGEAGFAAAWSAGLALNLDQAVANACELAAT